MAASLKRMRGFERVLQRSISADDNNWVYHVADLPGSDETNNAKLIKAISVISSATRQIIQLRFENAPENRVTWATPLDQLALVSCAEFRLQERPKTGTNEAKKYTARESADYLVRLLQTGIIINGTHYRFYGHSNSQLKSRSCLLYAGSKENISMKIEAMGDFSKLKSVGKKAKRIGLLFSTAEMGIELDPERCEDIDDIVAGDYNFTDGCGIISRQLAVQLAQKKRIIFRNKRYLPSVFQIRYRGYKGVLTFEPTLRGKTQAKFRDSMRKFKDAPNMTFSIVDYSKPYSFGYLNDQIVLLLHALGISTETLLRKQLHHLEFLSSVAGGNFVNSFRFLSYCNNMELAEKVLMEGFESSQGSIRKLVQQEYSKMLSKRGEQKCRILIPQSRLLFGICDPSSAMGNPGKLKEGQCFVRITADSDGIVRTITNTEVLVTRNPCLHPGDLQKFKAVDLPEFAHLQDCIVFPTRGKRPSADLMSGGDLDGDRFFVCWDAEVIPSTVSEPAEYPGVKEPATFKPITDDDRAEYFARYHNASLGRVNNLFLDWARLKGAMSAECQQLNRLFSQSVDGQSIKVPPNLEDPPKVEPSQENKFVLDVLHQASSEFIRTRVENDRTYEGFSPDAIAVLLNRDKIAIFEFELIQIALKWCKKNHVDLLDFADYFDFTTLSDEEKLWVSNIFPPKKSTCRLIWNGLLQSELVEPAELRNFKLDSSQLHWKRTFSSATDRMGRFLEATCRTLETFHKKLVVLRADERLTLIIYIPQKIPKAKECQVDASVRVFALPRSQGADSTRYRVLPTKVNYRLYCDEGALQLYELKRANTWIFLKRSASDDSTYRNIKSAGDRRRQHQKTVDEGINFDCRASVNLGKISSDIQRHVGRIRSAGVLEAEIYVISNRDVKSMMLLDRWLHYIDTQEVLPLYEREDIEYSIPTFKDFDWNTQERYFLEIYRGNLDRVRSLNPNELRNVLAFFSRPAADAGSLFRGIFEVALVTTASWQSLPQQRNMTEYMLELLVDKPSMICAFLTSDCWARHKDSLEDALAHCSFQLLKAVVLSSNTSQGFVVEPFRTILENLKRMSLQHFAELVELIALSVRSVEIVLDLLLECLEPHTSRLLVGRPQAVGLFVKGIFGAALDHVDEAGAKSYPRQDLLRLTNCPPHEGFSVVEANIRIDAPSTGVLKIGDHVRLTASRPPQNAPIARPHTMDAVVLKSEKGSATFRCLHEPPSYLTECSWELTNCASLVTTKTMLDAVTEFYTKQEACCRIYKSLAGLTEQTSASSAALPYVHKKDLNESQNEAVKASLTNHLSFLWGPPGTGKTHTIVVILMQLLNAAPKKRLLIAAPTHNAVDNVLKKFISAGGIEHTGVQPLRVSTSLAKVSPELKEYTCDALVGKEISADFKGRRQAQKRVKSSRLVFTTCAGAGLGLLRNENFEFVLIDEASQQTEPETLIPLIKGCERAILVGDHVQLRATVQKHAQVQDFDISLFERHYNMPARPGVGKVMLDTQYRMHRDICAFSSTEFYDSKLKTAVVDDERPLPDTQFTWPKQPNAPNALPARNIFVQCSSTEDLGHQSKSNAGQADICKKACDLLCQALTPTSSSTVPVASFKPPNIAILTPYTRQRELLTKLIPKQETSSVDGFQGREADIIIFVSVRCNAHGDLGFLKDMRRLNVAMTRAKAGVIIIGDKTTLTMGDERESKDVWARLLARCVQVGVEDLG